MKEGPIGWADWLANAGIEAGKVWKGTNFSDSDMALAAAELGQGVALASLFLAGDALAAGTLVRPFAAAVGSGRAWYALSSADRLDDGDVRDVWSWLGQQATEMETDQPVPRHDGR